MLITVTNQSHFYRTTTTNILPQISLKLLDFRRFYFAPACDAQNNRTSGVMTNASQTMLAVAEPSFPSNGTTHAYRDIEEEIESSVCRRETSLLFVLLMLGTRKCLSIAQSKSQALV